MSLINKDYFNFITNYNLVSDLYYETKMLDYKFAFIRGEKCLSNDDLFHEFSIKFNFPDYFGYNWDAFDECINDLDWLPAKGYVVFISNADEIIPSDEKSFSIFINILVVTVYEWVIGRNYDSFPTPPTPFYIFFHCKKKNEKYINELITKNIEYYKENYKEKYREIQKLINSM